MENRLVKQMKSIRVGIGELVENCIEQYHKTGFKYDMKYRKISSEVLKVVVGARRKKTQMILGI